MNRLSCGVALIALVSCAEVEVVSAWGTLEKNVATGVATQENVIATLEDGVLAKTGAGEWVLPLNLIQQNNEFVVNVNEGTAKIVGGGEPRIEGVEDVLNGAALWVASDDVSRLVIDADTTNVLKWCDMRETNVEQPTRDYVSADDADKLPTWTMSTKFAQTNGVYFGGYGSGVHMTFKTPAGEVQEYSTIRHIFIVIGVASDLGNTVGPRKGSDNNHCALSRSASGAYFNKYPNDQTRALIRGSATYRNGEYIDPFVEPVSKTLQLLDVKLTQKTQNMYASYFFRKRDEADTRGGDYLYEALIYTNDLTDVQGYKVSQYLLNKWNLKGVNTKRLQVSKSGTLVLAPHEDEVFSLSKVKSGGMVVTGDGLVVKSGAGEVLSDRERDVTLRGVFNLQEGTILARNPVWMIVEGGDAIQAVMGATGTRISNVSDNVKANEAQQRGDGRVYVREISEEVATYHVEEGATLVLTGTPRDPGVLRIPNGSFEDGESVSYNSKVKWPTGWTVGGVTNMYVDGETAPNIGSMQVGTTICWPATDLTSATGDVFDGRRYLMMSALNCTNGYAVSDEFVPGVRGRYRLAGIGKFYCSWIANNFQPQNDPWIRARIVVDGNEADAIDLGVLKIHNFYTKNLTWPEVFELNGNERVQVKLEIARGNSACALLDDLRFEKESEMLVNGTFDDVLWYGNAGTEESDPTNQNYEKSWANRIPSGWVRRNNMPTEASRDNSSLIDISSWEKDWSKEADSGTYLLRVCGLGSMEQRVNFDEAGIYQVRFMANTTLDQSWIPSRNPLRVWVVNAAGVTNEVYRTEVVSSNLTAHAALFRIPEAGVYTVGIQGTSVDVLANNRVCVSCVDSMSVRKYEEAESVALPKDLTINIAEGGGLALDFTGTQVVSRVTIAGKAYVGIVNAERLPGTVSGVGALDVRPKGTVLILR